MAVHSGFSVIGKRHTMPHIVNQHALYYRHRYYHHNCRCCCFFVAAVAVAVVIIIIIIVTDTAKPMLMEFHLLFALILRTVNYKQRNNNW